MHKYVINKAFLCNVDQVKNPYANFIFGCLVFGNLVEKYFKYVQMKPTPVVANELI